MTIHKTPALSRIGWIWFLSPSFCLPIWQLVHWSLHLCLTHSTLCICPTHVYYVHNRPVWMLYFFSSALGSVHSMMLHFNWLLLSCQSLLAVDVVGGASEGTAGWCVCRVSGSSAGPDQAFWPAAADYLAGYCQCHQRGRGPYTTAQVTIINACYTDAQHTLFS